MAKIVHFRKILKDDLFKRIKFFAEFLSTRDDNGDCPEWRFLKGMMRKNLPYQQDGAYELEYIALVVKKRTITAFRSNSVNRSMKPPITTKKDRYTA